MNLPESPHQAAIAKASVPEVTGPFKAKVRPVLHPQAAELVRIYEAVPGALTYPGCMPEGLAAVVEHLAQYLLLVQADCKVEMQLACLELMERSAHLRGEQP